MKRALGLAVTLSVLGVACSASPSGGTAPATSADGGPIVVVDPIGPDGGAQPCASDPCPGAVLPVGSEVDANCTDGKYSEALANPASDISALKSAYAPANYRAFIGQVLDARYPIGALLVKNAPTTNGDCIDTFLPASERTSVAKVFARLGTLVHECGHFYDNGLSSGASTGYQIKSTLKFACSGASYTGTNLTFARSRIRNDSFSQKRPPCPTKGSNGCDDYADVYLDGNPDDNKFESGDQGFNMVLEEAVQYVNSLASARAFEDQLPGGQSVSERDGILTYLWYVERYLHMSRTQYPAQYSYLMGDKNWRDAILTVWGRAWLYLEATNGHASLGIDDDKLEPLVHDAALLDEIARVRAASGCK